MMKKIVVVDYDPNWPQLFAALHAELSQAVGGVLLAIEHVGSTSVPGLAAKPVIDLDLVVATADMELAILRLASIGYVHRRDLGVEGREAFTSPPHQIAHHLYLCPADSLGLRNHLAVREFLRTHPDVAREYGQLKQQLAREFVLDIDGYIDGKTEFLLSILRQSCLSEEDLLSIEKSNRF